MVSNHTTEEVNVGQCDLCGNLNEVKTVIAAPKARLLSLFNCKIKIDVCQSCISQLMRGCYKDIGA